MIHNIHNLLNTIFNKHLSEIYKNNKIIRSEISEDKLVYYKFKYSQREETKQNIVSNINFKFNTNHNASSYYRKEKNISLTTYENILTDIKKLYLNINNNSNSNNSNNSLLAIDGTYGNTNIKRKKGKLQTTLFMCYYDITNNVPIDINFKMNKCNNEVKLAQKWLNEYKNINNEFIIVADRAYFKYDFFKFLINNDIKFVIRIRNNAKNIKNLNCRYLEKSFSIEKKVFNKKKNKYEIIICNNKYSILTNIKEETYTENKIFKIYEDRWNIEVFFKYLKKNFKFINLKEKKKEDNDKTITSQLIIIYISQILKKYFIENNKNKFKTSINKKNNTITTCKIKINESLLIEGIFENLLIDIINGKLNIQLIEKFINCYCKIIKNENNRSFERISLQPFTKWYIKKYLNDYKYCKILEALHNNNYEELNKNLKTKATTKVIK
jgi:hypothetical protein